MPPPVLPQPYPALLFDTSQGSDAEVFGRVDDGDLSRFGRVLHLVMVDWRFQFVPIILLMPFVDFLAGLFVPSVEIYVCKNYVFVNKNYIKI